MKFPGKVVVHVLGVVVEVFATVNKFQLGLAPVKSDPFHQLAERSLTATCTPVGETPEG